MIIEQKILKNIDKINKKYQHTVLDERTIENVKLNIFFYLKNLVDTNQIEIIPKDIKINIQSEPNIGVINITIMNSIYLIGEEDL